jgi:hypothetical protein
MSNPDDATLYVTMRRYFPPNGYSEVGQLSIPDARSATRLAQLELIAKEGIEFTMEVLNGGMVNLCMDDGTFDYRFDVVKPTLVNERVLLFIDNFSIEDYHKVAAIFGE